MLILLSNIVFMVIIIMIYVGRDQIIKVIKVSYLCCSDVKLIDLIIRIIEVMLRFLTLFIFIFFNYKY
jgi:hypothetical protein